MSPAGDTNSGGEVCFVCDTKVTDRAFRLSVEKTFFTQTSFPAKLSEMIGDDFMVVVTEEDKMCFRCATLINKSDKLEVDLKEIRNTITGLLNVKYNLTTEVESDGLQHSDVTSEDALEQLSSENVNATEETEEEADKYPPERSAGELQRFGDSGTISPSSNIYIKSEPVVARCSGHDGHFDISSGELVEVCEDVPAQMTTHAEIEGKVKKEIVPADDIPSLFPLDTLDVESSLICDTLNLDNQFSIIDPVYDNEVEYMTLLEENPSKTGVLSCNPPHESGIPPEVIKLNGKNKRASIKNSTGKISTLGNNFKKTLKVNDTKRPIKRKLRPILPKITGLNDIISLCIVDANVQNDSGTCTNNSSEGPVIPKKTEVDKASSPCSVDGLPKEQTLADNILTKKEVPQKLSKGNFCCKRCKSYFNDAESLENHQKEGCYKCNECNKVYKTSMGLKNHRPVHTGKFAFCCDICGMGFMFHGTLEEHRSKHTKEDRYVCDVCGKKFNFQSTYWIHRKWHDNPYPYKCSECGQLFKHSSMLSIHQRKHRGERPYKCSYCSLTFNVSNSLKRHLILHTKDYPYTCTSCGRGFTVRFKYTSHMAKTHNIVIEKPAVNKKDFKMAVHDEEEEKSSNMGKANVTQQEIVEYSESNTKDTDNSIASFPSELSDSIVEIVLGPSIDLVEVLSEPLTITDGWLS